jgi:hypothetical protein
LLGFAVLAKAKGGCGTGKDFTGYFHGLILPHEKYERYLGAVKSADISITPGFERIKVKRAVSFGIKNYGLVISRDFKINYNSFFHDSCLIRAFDFFSMKFGCDLRSSEVLIADAASDEGRNAFKILAPFVKRIILVTARKNQILKEVDMARAKYGTQAAVIEDPVKSLAAADAVILSSDDINHKCIAELKMPLLYYRFIEKPTGDLWFDDVDISFNGKDEMETVYAQAYVDINKKQPSWYNAENEGFTIKNIKQGDKKLIQLH